MGEWRGWKLCDWNEKLLHHFFGRDDDSDLPVVVLLVTPDQLAEATGDPAGGEKAQYFHWQVGSRPAFGIRRLFSPPVDFLVEVGEAVFVEVHLPQR